MAVAKIYPEPEKGGRGKKRLGDLTVSAERLGDVPLDVEKLG